MTPSLCDRPAAGRGNIRSVIVFDLDDTLYLERDYVESGLRAAGRWATTQLGLAGAGEDLIGRFRRGARTRLFDAMLANAGIAPAPALIARMLDVYRMHRPAIGLPMDSRRCLAARPADCAFAVITDGFLHAQKRKIRALGLQALGLRLAVCTDRWGRADWKPSPRSFEYVQARFGLPPHAFTYVADNPTKDFHAPKKIGWRTVQLSRGGRIIHDCKTGTVDADVQIESLDDLGQL